MSYPITCSDPGHAARSAQQGWRTVLGQSSVPNTDGHVCPACAKANPPPSPDPGLRQVIGSLSPGSYVAGGIVVDLRADLASVTIAKLTFTSRGVAAQGVSSVVKNSPTPGQFKVQLFAVATGLELANGLGLGGMAFDYQAQGPPA